MLETMAVDDVLAEVVEDHDLAGEPADVRNPADGVSGDLEAPVNPRFDRRCRMLMMAVV